MEANNIPRFEEVTNGAREREKHEYACRCHISPSQERVLATYPRNSGDYERLGSFEALYRIVLNTKYESH
jgi:hypothetical protein